MVIVPCKLKVYLDTETCVDGPLGHVCTLLFMCSFYIYSFYRVTIAYYM
jgi:hypothetical protein